MFLTLDECVQAWEAAGQHGTKKERIARNARWIPFYSYVTQSQLNHSLPADPHARKIAGILEDAGVLHPNCTVLDVGAGTGRFSLAFGELGANVTALDMDEASLVAALNRARANGIRSMEIEQGMWELFEPKGKYDVVFSSMCPAICDYEELLKMEAIARESCALIAVTRGSYDKHRKALMKELNVQPAGMTTEALWYYNTLYLMGRQPNVVNFTQHAEFSVPMEKAIEHNKVYFEIFGMDPSASEPKLREYFERHAVDGMIPDVSHVNTALIWWNVP